MVSDLFMTGISFRFKYADACALPMNPAGATYH